MYVYRERERERQRDRETKRQRDRETKRQRDRGRDSMPDSTKPLAISHLLSVERGV